MKHWPLLFIVLALLTSCAPQQQDDVSSAAMDIYRQYYRHSASLTVAFIGDYHKDGQTYNAVMLRTTDSLEWQWLKEQFGIFSIDEVRASRDVSMMTPATGGNSTPALDEQEQHGVIMGTIEVDSTRDFKDTAEFLAYIDSLTFAMLSQMYGDSVARLRMRPVMVMDLDSMPQQLPQQKVKAHQQMDRFTQDHGNAAYLVNVDCEHQTIWLFFYDTTTSSE